jgi:hypothetical protein
MDFEVTNPGFNYYQVLERDQNGDRRWILIGIAWNLLMDCIAWNNDCLERKNITWPFQNGTF